jgi:hypothetical protein
MNQKDLIRELSQIVKHGSVAELHHFKASHPDITLFDTVVENCGCGCAEKCSAFSSLDITTVQKDFVDALFSLGYMSDPMVLCDIFRYMNKYESWGMVNYILSKFDSEALRSCYTVMDEGTQYEYIDDPLTVFYAGCHVTRYWGKIHPGARECYERLVSAGCTSRYSNPDVDKLKQLFMDDAYHIEWQYKSNAHEFQKFRESAAYEEWLKI